MCSIVALEKLPGVWLVGIGETLCQALAKLVLRAAGDQENTSCGKLQLFAGLEDIIEGGTNNVRSIQEEGGTTDQYEEEESHREVWE